MLDQEDARAASLLAVGADLSIYENLLLKRQ
jgi:hypothetical protein